MKKISIIILLAFVLLVVGCKASKNDIQPSNLQTNNSSLVISNGEIKWDEDKNALSFDEFIKKVPFEVKQPEVPFEITNKAIGGIEAPFDFIQMTSANDKLGFEIILAISNSKDNSKPQGKKGVKLENGSQTWIQSDQSVSALYWRYDGLTYVLSSLKIENGNFLPLYDTEKLVEIANTIK
ncbi:hypothetical protein E0485_11425 [Paenibacillus albiflavus]|uniref:DUF4367 domain-containing protein n=1 Tax=Paenibacillus albiflavus TaxID=2545760 RepID=A0A4R4EDH8_9BACL|nr:hypothetical protein [Paenibacillus albiflavus]TCZ77070.1 hypothetical protein E0485_11425 [Paenibacillus albiflavus]